MSDAISRHGVSAWLDNMGYPRLANIIMDENRFPSVKPERKRGKWIYSQEAIAFHPFGTCACSVCGKKSEYYYDFCPNCGADMRGEADE